MNLFALFQFWFSCWVCRVSNCDVSKYNNNKYNIIPRQFLARIMRIGVDPKMWVFFAAEKFFIVEDFFRRKNHLHANNFLKSIFFIDNFLDCRIPGRMQWCSHRRVLWKTLMNLYFFNFACNEIQMFSIEQMTSSLRLYNNGSKS